MICSFRWLSEFKIIEIPTSVVIAPSQRELRNVSLSRISCSEADWGWCLGDPENHVNCENLFRTAFSVFALSACVQLCDVMLSTHFGTNLRAATLVLQKLILICLKICYSFYWSLLFQMPLAQDCLLSESCLHAVGTTLEFPAGCSWTFSVTALPALTWWRTSKPHKYLQLFLLALLSSPRYSSCVIDFLISHSGFAWSCLTGCRCGLPQGRQLEFLQFSALGGESW